MWNWRCKGGNTVPLALKKAPKCTMIWYNSCHKRLESLLVKVPWLTSPREAADIYVSGVALPHLLLPRPLLGFWSRRSGNTDELSGRARVITSLRDVIHFPLTFPRGERNQWLLSTEDVFTRRRTKTKLVPFSCSRKSTNSLFLRSTQKGRLTPRNNIVLREWLIQFGDNDLQALTPANKSIHSSFVEKK